jgi:predicted flap endonuclease-1-like 5' DNA nuclease
VLETVEPVVIEPEPVIESNVMPPPTVEAAAAMVDEGAPAIQPIIPDDLTRIEGIGPKMSAALIAAGIDSYAKLAATSVEELRSAIQSQGMRFAPSLTTWPEQAGYAAKADWEGLVAMQQNLKAGR